MKNDLVAEHLVVPAEMLDPELLEPFEAWQHFCDLDSCGKGPHGALATQGGRAGLDAHRLVVHGMVKP